MQRFVTDGIDQTVYLQSACIFPSTDEAFHLQYSYDLCRFQWPIDVVRFLQSHVFFSCFTILMPPLFVSHLKSWTDMVEMNEWLRFILIFGHLRQYSDEVKFTQTPKHDWPPNLIEYRTTNGFQISFSYSIILVVASRFSVNQLI